MLLLPAQRRALQSLVCVCLLAAFAAPLSLAQSDPPGDSPASAVPVFVSDFELASVPVQPKPAARSTAAKQNPGPPVVYDDTEVPSAQARRLMDFFTMTLLAALRNKGFQAARSTSQNPLSGALIRGVFAEPDTHNRVRRALLGGTSPNSRFLLYVGIFNLAREDQPLYQPAPDQAQAPPSNRYGPVITLNNYVPLAKYELDKNPSEEDVQKICNQIAASLTALLEGNPMAFSQ